MDSWCKILSENLVGHECLVDFVHHLSTLWDTVHLKGQAHAWPVWHERGSHLKAFSISQLVVCIVFYRLIDLGG